MSAAAPRVVGAFRTVQAATLAALLWKFEFFVGLTKIYSDMPLHQHLFPAFFQAPVTFSASYAGVVVSLAVALVARRAVVRLAGSWGALLALSTLCLHQGGYNDATFTTAWWAALWSVWFAGRTDDADDEDGRLRRGARLSRAIVSVVLLGGAVGKWTSEYWSGQVFYEIYFTSRDFWLFNLMRNTWDAESLRSVATWYSRGIILIESGAGLLIWALPPRLAAVLGVTLSLSVAAFTNSYLYSVVLSLAGLAAVGFWVRTAPAGAAPSTP